LAVQLPDQTIDVSLQLGLISGVSSHAQLAEDGKGVPDLRNGTTHAAQGGLLVC
jgi:hypothetical protein